MISVSNHVNAETKEDPIVFLCKQRLFTVLDLHQQTLMEYAW